MSDALKSLTSSELADLKAKAKAAAPGRWVVYNETDIWTVDDKPIACTDFGDVTEFAKNNVAHIAAANPETILRLIDMVERRDAWRPIETAPRGDHRLLVWDSGAVSKDAGAKVWRSSGSDLNQFTRAGITHWQPLAVPPSEALGATEPVNDKR